MSDPLLTPPTDPFQNPNSGLESVWTVWWNAIDKWSFLAILSLMAVGVWLIMAVSPAVALHHHWSPFVLLKRHLIMIIPGLCVLMVVSFFNRPALVWVARIVGVGAWCAVWLTLVYGVEIKGARRWLTIAQMSLQPSEFLKPALAVMVADMLARGVSMGWAVVVLGLSAAPLLLQPDLGMAAVFTIIVFSQCFAAGLPWIWTVGGAASALAAVAGAFVIFPHAAHRVQVFLAGGGQDPFGSQYQILQALKSFASGGLWGRGPGAGVVLNSLPDGHADFVFAVAGEELGLVACLLILALYGIIVFRTLGALSQEIDRFYVLAGVGLIIQFAVQTLMNMASVLRMIPTKGVTLPFLSYGGSSLISLCWGVGMILALTRRYRALFSG